MAELRGTRDTGQEASAPIKPPLRIIEFRAENVKRINAVTIRPDPEDAMVLVTGKNGQGKTSTLDAIWWAAGGAAGIPSKPVKAGAKGGQISLDLGEFIVVRRFTASGGEYLDVRTKDGFTAPRPQEFLSSRLADRARNPLEFMRLNPGDQVKALQGMVDLKLDLAEFEGLCGLDLSKVKPGFDPVKLMDDAYKYTYEQRTKANAEIKRLDGAVESLAVQIPPDKAETQAVSVAELFAEKEVLQKEKESNDRARVKFEESKKEVALLIKGINDQDKDIAALEEKLATLRARREVANAEMEKHRDALAIEEERVSLLEDPPMDDVNERIKTADVTNHIAGLVTSLAEHRAKLDRAKDYSAYQTEVLTSIKEYKTRLIQEAGLPVPGLGFDAGEVTYNGIPLSQASGREQIEISVAICAAANPAIAVLTIDSGWNELDAEGKEVIERFARERNLQIWCASVTDSPGSKGFHIFDGSLVAIDGVPVEPEAPRAEEPRKGRKSKSGNGNGGNGSFLKTDTALVAEENLELTTDGEIVDSGDIPF